MREFEIDDDDDYDEYNEQDYGVAISKEKEKEKEKEEDTKPVDASVVVDEYCQLQELIYHDNGQTGGKYYKQFGFVFHFFFFVVLCVWNLNLHISTLLDLLFLLLFFHCAFCLN